MPRRRAAGTVRRTYSLPAELVEALEETADELDLGPGVLVRYAVTGYLDRLELPAGAALHSAKLNVAVLAQAGQPADRRLELKVEALEAMVDALQVLAGKMVASAGGLVATVLGSMRS